jgi:large subunit ribosomal protein L28
VFRKHALGGKAPQSGCNVSHSHRKTNRKWNPNIQTQSLYSMALGVSIPFTIPMSELRTVDAVGGLDNYLLRMAPETLSTPLRRIRKLVMARQKPVVAAS